VGWPKGLQCALDPGAVAGMKDAGQPAVIYLGNHDRG
jgi:hypothetical protein